MSITLVVLLIGLAFCFIALTMTLWNLLLYRRVGVAAIESACSNPVDLISIAIPARNEQDNLEACVRSLLAGRYTNIEVLVYNDHSTDQTGAILARLSAQDPRVRAVEVVDLPADWNGKQFGCHRMGLAAKGRWVLFTDADVRFAPDAIGAALAAARALNADLVSTFPRQITASLAEHLAVPMIHFILFSYLPLISMRTSLAPSASAGCGQFLFARREPYLTSGGHAGFAASMHDGIKLPRQMRKAGFKTDLFDGTDVCSVRMYRGLSQTWRGFTKNAFEGLGSVGLLVFITVVHALAHVLPWVVVAVWAIAAGAGFESFAVRWTVAAAAACVLIALFQRLVLAARFRQSLIGALLHPVAVTMMTLIQWHSLLLHKMGQRAWRGRVAGTPSTVTQA